MGREELKYYGGVVANYEGQGCLTLGNGWRWECSFGAGQLSDGKALLICHIPLDKIPISERSQLSLVDTARSFEGASEDYSILANKGFRVLNKFFDTKVKPANYVVAYFMHEFYLEMKGKADAKTLHFGITNFEISQIAPKLIPCGGSMAQGAMLFQVTNDYQPEGLTLCLKDDANSITTHLSIRPLPNYYEIVNRIKILKSIDVTCEIVVDTEQGIDIKSAEGVVNNLCYLLSILRGTKIHWVYCYKFNAAGESISRKHVSKEPKPFCPHFTISPNADLKLVKDFIEQTYPIYIKIKMPYRLDSGTIDSYLDAKAEFDYMSIRGVKLAVALEILKNAFLLSRESRGSSIEEFIINKKFFENKIAPTIKQEIEKTIITAVEERRAKGGENINVNFEAIYEKIPELNRYAFHRALNELFNEIKFHPPEEDIKRFLRCRNSLIHTGMFHCYKKSLKNGRTCTINEIREEFFFLVNFLDKIFLRLIGYSGYYSNWSTFPPKVEVEYLDC